MLYQINQPNLTTSTRQQGELLQESLKVKRPPQRAALIPEFPQVHSVPAEAGVALRSTTLYIKAVTAV
jgi:hypothetical protein